MPASAQSPVPDSPIDTADVRRAYEWSVASVAWTFISGAIAILAGVTAGSLLLVAFGAVGALDAMGSTLLAVHFRHALHHEAISAQREHRALVAIAVGMAVIAVATLVASGYRLVTHAETSFSPVGTAVAACSVLALALLARKKHVIGERVRSRALIADSHVSTMGAFLALFTVAGTIVASAFGWWWLDPIGSSVVALVGLFVATGHGRAAPDQGI